VCFTHQGVTDCCAFWSVFRVISPVAPRPFLGMLEVRTLSEPSPVPSLLREARLMQKRSQL
jgi:hypothetical protein